MYCVFEMIEFPDYDAPFIESFDVFTSIMRLTLKSKDWLMPFKMNMKGRCILNRNPMDLYE